MYNNVIPFPTPASLSRAGYREAVKATSTTVDLFQAPGESVSEAPAKKACPSTLALTPANIWSALCNRRVRVHYQPQYDIASGNIVAAEALVRLIDTEGQLIFPDRFIDLAERSDLIVPLGRAVIEQVCEELGRCLSQGTSLRRVAINLSARQLNVDTQLPDFVDQLVTRHGLDYSALEFELTERQELLQDSAGMSILQTLARRGARIVIDDFGMGYSSVAYLTLSDLPVSAIKLDRALVSRLPDDKTIVSVVRSLLTLAADLELDVVAEGVETDAQNECLANAGCLIAQGFGYARPMAIGDLQNFIAEKNVTDCSHLQA